MYEEENLPWWKVSLIVWIYVATSISATMNTYWMYLIICQVIRLIKRSLGATLENNQQSEELGQYASGGEEQN